MYRCYSIIKGIKCRDKTRNTSQPQKWRPSAKMAGGFQTYPDGYGAATKLIKCIVLSFNRFHKRFALFLEIEELN